MKPNWVSCWYEARAQPGSTIEEKTAYFCPNATHSGNRCRKNGELAERNSRAPLWGSASSNRPRIASRRKCDRNSAFLSQVLPFLTSFITSHAKPSPPESDRRRDRHTDGRVLASHVRGAHRGRS